MRAFISLDLENIGVKKENITDKSWIYFLEKDYCFFRISFPFNFTQNPYSVVPEGHSSISVEIAYGNNNPFPENLFVKTIGQGPNKPVTILDPDGVVLFSEDFGMKGWVWKVNKNYHITAFLL